MTDRPENTKPPVLNTVHDHLKALWDGLSKGSENRAELWAGLERAAESRKELLDGLERASTARLELLALIGRTANRLGACVLILAAWIALNQVRGVLVPTTPIITDATTTAVVQHIAESAR